MRQSNNFSSGYNQKKPSAQEEAEKSFQELRFNPAWITNGVDSSMITFAEKAGKVLKKYELTPSQFRNIYGELKRIQMGGYNTNMASFLMLRPKVAYMQGRSDTNVGIRVFKLIFDHAADKVVDKTTFNNFCNLMEAVLAYHRAESGKE